MLDHHQCGALQFVMMNEKAPFIPGSSMILRVDTTAFSLPSPHLKGAETGFLKLGHCYVPVGRPLVCTYIYRAILRSVDVTSLCQHYFTSTEAGAQSSIPK